MFSCKSVLCVHYFYITGLEFIPAEKRAVIGTARYAIVLTVGGAYMPWLIKYVEDWKIFHHILFSQVAKVYYHLR